MALIEFGKLTGVALIAGVFGPCHRLVDANIDDWQSGLQINVLAQLNMVSPEGETLTFLATGSSWG